MYDTLLLDISGVLYQGDEVIPGAVEAVRRLRKAGKKLRFVTNTSRKPAGEVEARLRGLGFEPEPGALFTAPHAARRWLAKEGYRPLLIVHPDLMQEFADMQTDEPNAVLLADAEEGLSYRNLDHAFALLMEGAPLVAIGDNRYFHGGDRLHLDAGPFVKALEYAASVEAHIAGKPSELFFRQAVEDAGGRPETTLMVGDDVHADVEGAINAGLHACLVKTGKYREGDEAVVEGRARVEASIRALVDNII